MTVREYILYDNQFSIDCKAPLEWRYVRKFYYYYRKSSDFKVPYEQRSKFPMSKDQSSLWAKIKVPYEQKPNPMN